MNDAYCHDKIDIHSDRNKVHVCRKKHMILLILWLVLKNVSNTDSTNGWIYKIQTRSDSFRHIHTGHGIVVDGSDSWGM